MTPFQSYQNSSHHLEHNRYLDSDMKRTFAILFLSCIYTFTRLITLLPRYKRKRNETPVNRVIVCVTIDNPNWFKAHIEPLARSDYGEIRLVCDEPVSSLPNLIYACPPLWMQKTFSRAGAKFVYTLWQGYKHPADLFMGYHIFPCALIALICARLLGSKAAYQVTSGITEIEGGGYGAENSVLKALGGNSLLVENISKAVIRQFDVIFVRGSSVKKYLMNLGYENQLEILTGSIFPAPELMQTEREIDVVFVGRLAEIKQIDTLINAIAELLHSHPRIKVSIVGDGPELLRLEQLSSDLGTSQNIEFMGQRSDVSAILGKSKLFVLTSRSESVSIAMLEAMAMKTVPIVTQVGDLSDFVDDGVSGYMIPVGDSSALAEKIKKLLGEPAHLESLAIAGSDEVLERCTRQQIATYWVRLLNEIR